MIYAVSDTHLYVDYAISFEELQARFDSRNIILGEQEETEWNQASYYGRIFARSGGLSKAITQALKELDAEDFDFEPVICDGIDKCRQALMRANKGALSGNFIEGMACVEMCIRDSCNAFTHLLRGKTVKSFIIA